MQQFTTRHAAEVFGMLSGLDRVRFRGTLRWLANNQGMRNFLWTAGVLLKDFTAYALQVTAQVRQATAALALAAGRPVRYLGSTAVSKEEQARRIAAADGVSEGLICVLSCVEPCFSYEVWPNRQTKRLELRGGQRKCLHYYFYAIDPALGFLHLRLQTWFPFTIHVCINGREWLARELDRRGIAYLRRDNCFPWVQDVAGAQRLLDAQVKVNWPTVLGQLAARFHPTHAATFAAHPTSYYWSADATEWASDVMFRSPQRLGRLYPRLVRQSMQSLHSVDVLRFLGHLATAHGGVHGHFRGAVTSDCRRVLEDLGANGRGNFRGRGRPEGVRVMHRLNHNSLKMYDKQGSVLRVETTINDPRDIRIYRRKEGQAKGRRAWRSLRKGVADLTRRAQVSQAANDRYLNSLAAVDDPTSLGELTARLCRPVRFKGRRTRALHPLADDDLRLLEAIRRGEFAINGLRNRDLQPLLFPTPAADATERRRRAAKITRQLRLLRAHKLLRKVSGTHRYALTATAAVTIDALLAARNASTEQLQRLAA